MQLSSKLTLSLTITSSLILGSYGLWQLRQEERDLRGTAEHDLRLLGTAVQIAVENSIRDRQIADVREILDALEFRDPALDVLLFDPEGHLQANSWGSGASVSLVRESVANVNATERPQIYFDGPNKLARLVGVFPLRNDAGRGLGAVAVVWPLDELRRDLHATARAAVLSSLSVIVGITIVGWLLALVFVRRPLRTLTQGMKAVEGGNWVTTVRSDATDEVGSALSQFNAMMRELSRARQDLVAAAESREALEMELQRLDKLATIGQLSAGLAHEIGSPLQVLNGRARAIAARSDLPAEITRSARILEEQSDRIARIIDQLLSLARRQPAKMAEIDVRAAVAPIVELMTAEARRRHIELEFTCADALPRVWADVDHVQQITMNLLTNAFRATSDGGRVRIGLAASAFTPRGTTEDVPAIRLVVEDNGAGITEETRRRMFEPFFTTWKDGGGTGLGLSIVKAIVEEHGGLVDVASDYETGTQLTVHLPVAGAATPTRSEPRVGDPGAATPTRCEPRVGDPGAKRIGAVA